MRAKNPRVKSLPRNPRLRLIQKPAMAPMITLSAKPFAVPQMHPATTPTTKEKRANSTNTTNRPFAVLSRREPIPGTKGETFRNPEAHPNLVIRFSYLITHNPFPYVQYIIAQDDAGSIPIFTGPAEIDSFRGAFPVWTCKTVSNVSYFSTGLEWQLLPFKRNRIPI
jgi:hypothetical protein